MGQIRTLLTITYSDNTAGCSCSPKYTYKNASPSNASKKPLIFKVTKTDNPAKWNVEKMASYDHVKKAHYDHARSCEKRLTMIMFKKRLTMTMLDHVEKGSLWPCKKMAYNDDVRSKEKLFFDLEWPGDWFLKKTMRGRNNLCKFSIRRREVIASAQNHLPRSHQTLQEHSHPNRGERWAGQVGFPSGRAPLDPGPLLWRPTRPTRHVPLPDQRHFRAHLCGHCRDQPVWPAHLDLLGRADRRHEHILRLVQSAGIFRGTIPADTDSIEEFFDQPAIAASFVLRSAVGARGFPAEVAAGNGAHTKVLQAERAGEWFGVDHEAGTGRSGRREWLRLWALGACKKQWKMSDEEIRVIDLTG